MNKETKQLTQRAGAAVDALEAVPAGAPWADVAGDADRAVAELRDIAAGELFPPGLEPASADVLAQFAFLEPKTPASYGVELAQLHASSVTSHPELATLLRSPAIVARVLSAGAAQSVVQARSAAELANETLAAYQLAVAQQLTDDAEHGEAAVLFVDVGTLLHRITAAKETHEAHAVAELERVECERADAERVVDEQRAELQRETDAEAAELERVAKGAQYKAELQRASALADRLEAQGKTVRLENRRPYGVAGLAGLLRGGDVSPKRVRQIEAILARSERAA